MIARLPSNRRPELASQSKLIHFPLEEVERDHILRVFRETGGVISITATRLGVPRTTLNAMMKKLGISRSDL
jgi:transcriptional regulator of acetoin/glycerol metabolism